MIYFVYNKHNKKDSLSKTNTESKTNTKTKINIDRKKMRDNVYFLRKINRKLYKLLIERSKLKDIETPFMGESQCIYERLEILDKLIRKLKKYRIKFITQNPIKQNPIKQNTLDIETKSDPVNTETKSDPVNTEIKSDPVNTEIKSDSVIIEIKSDSVNIELPKNNKVSNMILSLITIISIIILIYIFYYL